MTTTAQRVPYLDRLRIFAAFCVVVLHVCAGPWQSLPPAELTWQASNLFNALVRFSVPVFFMLSGAVFLAPEREVLPRRLFGRHLLRMVTAFLFWSLAYSVTFNVLLPDAADWPAFWRDFAYGHYHMWFLFTMMGLYIATPMLRCICRERRCAEYFLLVSFLAVICVNTLKLIPPLTAIVEATMAKLHLEFFLGCTGYFVLGHYLASYALPRRFERAICLLGGVSLVFTVAATAILSGRDGVGNTTWFGNLLPNTYFTAAAMFLLFRRRANAAPKTELRVKVVMTLSRLTFGIYLVHDFFIKLLAGLGLTADAFAPVITVPLSALIVFVLSAAASWALGKIPVVNRYLV